MGGAQQWKERSPAPTGGGAATRVFSAATKRPGEQHPDTELRPTVAWAAGASTHGGGGPFRGRGDTPGAEGPGHVPRLHWSWPSRGPRRAWRAAGGSSLREAAPVQTTWHSRETPGHSTAGVQHRHPPEWACVSRSVCMRVHVHTCGCLWLAPPRWPSTGLCPLPHSWQVTQAWGLGPALQDTAAQGGVTRGARARGPAPGGDLGCGA